jgi:hypothetical protein
MKQQEVFKKIGGIIKELNDQYEYLKTVDGKLNELELELFIANSHFLTDHVVILDKLNAQLNIAPKLIEEPKPVAGEKFFEPLVQAAIPVEQDEMPEADLALNNNETIRHELILDESEVWEDEDEIQEAEVIEEPVKEDEPEIVPVIELLVNEVKKPEVNPVIAAPKETTKPEVLTINQKISAQIGDKNAIGETLSAQPISDLKTAITLNDKLLFIKELFKGYNLAYSEALDILNRFESFDEADRFLQKNYVVKNDWESKPDAANKFFALLKRRYA